AHSGKGDVAMTLQRMEEKGSMSNPLVNIFFQIKKRQYHSRFVEQDEEFDPISSNAKINGVVDLFRQYWNGKFLGVEGVTNEALLNDLSMLLTGNAQAAEVSNDAVLGLVIDLIESEGLFGATFLLNGSYGLKVWEKQTSENRRIELPDDTIDVEVVLIEDYLLRGASDYASLGLYGDGGWVAPDNKVYCNTGEYDFDSERFRISFLKHEGLHYADINKYPNLSSADLEYRSKLIELMYSTDGHIYTTLESFAINAYSEDRSYGHSFANHVLISQLSKSLFDQDFVKEKQLWKTIPPERINAAAKKLYEASRATLAADPMVAEII
ncbi:MAG: hypothetical protein P1V35_18040, partial [Planctomycetota bacterium]|nr:hypothetical protein [Planctomycetota bacterium]